MTKNINSEPSKALSVAQEDARYQSQDYLDYIRGAYARISEEQQHTGITRWALMGGLAYVTWQSIPMLVKVQAVNFGWQALCLVSALLLVISSFGFHLYQGLNISQSTSPYAYRQFSATASAKAPLSVLVLFVSFGPPAFFAYLAWEMVPSLTPITYRFLSLVVWFMAGMSVLMLGIIIYNARYLRKNGFMLPALWVGANRANGKSMLIWNSVQMLFIGAAVYFLAKSLDRVPVEILEQVLLLGGSMAIVPPCIEVILSGVHVQGRLSLLATLERDILMHDLSVEEIKARLENDLIGSELGDWAKRQVERVRAKHNELTGFCEEVVQILQQVSELDVSLTFERRGRLEQCVDRMEQLTNELNESWEPVNLWLNSFKNQPFLDPYIKQVVQGALDDLTPLMRSAASAAKHSLGLLRSQAKELDK